MQDRFKVDYTKVTASGSKLNSSTTVSADNRQDAEKAVKQKYSAQSLVADIIIGAVTLIWSAKK